MIFSERQIKKISNIPISKTLKLVTTLNSMQVFPIPLSPYKTLHILHCSNLFFSLEKLKLFIQSTSKWKSRRQHDTARWCVSATAPETFVRLTCCMDSHLPWTRLMINPWKNKGQRESVFTRAISKHRSDFTTHNWREKKTQLVPLHFVCYLVLRAFWSTATGQNGSGTCH